MTRTLAKDAVLKAGEKAELCGWVDARRDHGKIIFIDLRDRSGVVQVVFLSKMKELYATADSLRPEWVVRLVGTVNKRPAGMENSDATTGGVEILAEEIEILNRAETPPIALGADGYEIGEESRLKYRYLDLRRRRLQKNIRNRHKLTEFMRGYLSENDFAEIETPILTKSTPEGARDYLVPSRLHRGKFYALPQSPQQYKQLLMVAGFERYFQVARCFRDEDTRGDRQPEFVQLDMELSFTDEEEIMGLVENMLTTLIEKLLPEKKIARLPFPRISYAEAMEKYGSDKPDIRDDKKDENILSFLWVTDFSLFEYSETEKRLVSTHHPFTRPDDEAVLDSAPEKSRARAYDLVLNGFEIGGGSLRVFRRDLQEKIFSVLGLSKGDYESKFGHLLEAFDYGAPPHGGIALGLDRLFAILFNEPNIREVMAFPKTGDGRDLMMDAPAEADEKQLKELGLEIKKKGQ
ncbi:MAG: aspartate--tRNA ligase [Parcubacteria group bacterium]|nr:aspartate--tRNA ligase [Parcubacteria group bacterium]